LRGVTTHEVLAEVFDLPLGRLERKEQMRAAAVLRACGWTDVRREDTIPGRPRYYRPAETH
jgi:hypothetical protein